MTKQVKIVLFDKYEYADDYYDYSSLKVIKQGITDWETISDEDYEFIRNNLYYLKRIYHDKPGIASEPILIVKDDRPVIDTIKKIKEAIEKTEQDRRAEEEKEAAMKADRARKRQAKKEEKERALLEQLQKKFEQKNDKIHR